MHCLLLDSRDNGKRCEWPTLLQFDAGSKAQGKFVDVRLRVAGRNLLQRALQSGVGLDAVHLAGLDELMECTPF